ncbi:MAG: DNA primase [Candidatus Eremiobacteraeota bacterium]|nr:DNA primase [Candidatus Eremiobacteraeota bacterium]MBV9700331.1 DNA primase [Candidatus Eremiobacteraeota bacterium]
MRYDQDALREIRARVEIASLIGQYVPLKKRGNDLVGLCPFHAEKTPSFHVHPDRGFFKCFGCGAGGDAITFLQRLEQLTFGDAVRALAAKAGIQLEPENPATTRARSEREAIYEANRLAAGFFARMLVGERGAAARDYCAKRGFSAATIERFGLGYAPNAWNALADELQRDGVALETAARAGLVKAGQRGFYDFYRDRLMVPTYATTGEVIAFGGRILGDGEPKYLNTTTTPVYTKGRHLYALNLARRAAGDRSLIVVEGYLDCIALHQAGFENTVASLGTSFTAEQAAELKKYADYIFLCFDGDAAGSAAATKAVDVASNVVENAGLSVKIVALPPGEDPDSFVRSHGSSALTRLLETAPPAIQVRIDQQIERLRAGFDSPAKVAPKAETLIRGLTPREEWDRWRVYVAARLQVSVDDLRNSRFLSDSANFAPRIRTAPSESRHVAASVEPLSFEREVITILLEEPQLAAEFGDRIEASRFRNEIYRRVYEKIIGSARHLTTTADILGLFAEDQGVLELLSELSRRDRSSTVRYGDTDQRRAHLERVVDRLRLQDERQRYRELSDLIDHQLADGRPVPQELRGEFEALVAKLKR